MSEKLTTVEERLCAEVLHRVLLCDQNNVQALHAGGVKVLHLDAPKNTDNEKKRESAFLHCTAMFVDMMSSRWQSRAGKSSTKSSKSNQSFQDHFKDVQVHNQTTGPHQILGQRIFCSLSVLIKVIKEVQVQLTLQD